MVYMSAVLQTYDQLLNQMLKQLPVATPTGAENAAAATGTGLRTQLSYILKKITDLRTQHYRKHEELLKKIQTLRHVQVRRRGGGRGEGEKEGGERREEGKRREGGRWERVRRSEEGETASDLHFQMCLSLLTHLLVLSLRLVG